MFIDELNILITNAGFKSKLGLDLFIGEHLRCLGNTVSQPSVHPNISILKFAYRNNINHNRDIHFFDKMMTHYTKYFSNTILRLFQIIKVGLLAALLLLRVFF